jgi:nucleotide-binding universal stress UspA family protein
MTAQSGISSPFLVPHDGSALADQALSYALALVDRGATIILLRVIPTPDPIHVRSGQVLVSADAVLATNAEEAQVELARAAERVPEATATVRIEVTSGDIAEQILRTIEERDGGIIVMASRGRGTLGRWAFGSVADRIARTSPVPVMIVRGNDEDDEPRPVAINRLIVPLDGSELAAEALPVARTLAGRLGLPVLLIRVVDPTRILAPAHGAGMVAQAELYDLVHDQLVSEAEETLAEATVELRAAGVPTESEVGVGSAAQRIAAEARAGDVIVLTSRGRSGVRRWLLGSVAEQLVRSGPVPVVLVPDTQRRASEQLVSPAETVGNAGPTKGA